MADSNDRVTIRVPLDRALTIVTELKRSGIKFEWWYIPPTWVDGEYVRLVQFKFAEEKYEAWFQLKYG